MNASPKRTAEKLATHPDRWWNARTLTRPEIQEAIVQAYMRGREDEFEEWTGRDGGNGEPAPAAPPERRQVADSATPPERPLKIDTIYVSSRPKPSRRKPGEPVIPDRANWGPTDHVRDFIKSNPGTSNKRIIDACAKYSGAANQRSGITCIVSQMIVFREIEVDENGGRWIKGTLPTAPAPSTPSPQSEVNGPKLHSEPAPVKKAAVSPLSNAVILPERVTPTGNGSVAYPQGSRIHPDEIPGATPTEKFHNLATLCLNTPRPAPIPILAKRTPKPAFYCAECKKQWAHGESRHEKGCHCDARSIPIHG